MTQEQSGPVPSRSSAEPTRREALCAALAGATSVVLAGCGAASTGSAPAECSGDQLDRVIGDYLGATPCERIAPPVEVSGTSVFGDIGGNGASIKERLAELRTLLGDPASPNIREAIVGIRDELGLQETVADSAQGVFETIGPAPGTTVKEKLEACIRALGADPATTSLWQAINGPATPVAGGILR